MILPTAQLSRDVAIRDYESARYTAGFLPYLADDEKKILHELLARSKYIYRKTESKK